MPAITIQDLENAKADVDHLAAVATSLAPTATDRLGHVKQTIAGAMDSIDADVGAVESKKVTAFSGIDADVGAVESKKVTAISDIDADVAELGGVVNWSNTYLGGKTASPTQRNNGAPLQNGDLYFSIPVNRMMAYANGTWYATETAGATDAALVSTGSGRTQADKNADYDFWNGPRASTYELIAHRGFLGLMPENTMTAFSCAHSLGATSLECDVQISSDGVPVVIHDATVDRTTDGAGNVSGLTFEQLQLLDAGSAFSAKFASSKIPSFDEFVRFGKSRSVTMYPEIKGYRTQTDIDLILEVINNNQAAQNVVLQSGNISDLQYIRTKNKHIALGFLAGGISNLATVAALGGKLYMLVSYATVLANPSWVKTCRDSGVDISVWTVDTVEDVKSLLDIGVTKIMSNYWIGDAA